MSLLDTPLDELIDDAIPYVPARHQRGPKTESNLWIVVHDMEAPETLERAESTAAYFATTDREASTQMSVDNNSVVRSVHDHMVCYGAYGLNWRGLHMEHAGYAHQSREDWLDDYSLSMLDISARVAAAWCVKYDIPGEYVGVDGIVRKRPGIVTHYDSTKAFNVRGGHTDPGAHFPMDVYVQYVAKHLANPKSAKPQAPKEPELQTSIVRHQGRKNPDGSWRRAPGMFTVFGNNVRPISSPEEHQFLAALAQWEGAVARAEGRMPALVDRGHADSADLVEALEG